MNNQKLDLDNLLKIAIAASLEAKLRLQECYSAKDVISNAARDLKSLADLDSQELIINHLKKHSIFRIISEEIENTSIEDNEVCWIIDPLDGTINFMKEIPFYAISISLWRGDQPLLGLIQDIARNNTYSAIIDQGAMLNGKNIFVSKNTNLDQSILATGFPTLLDHSTENLNKFIKDIQSYKKVRMFGSAAMSLAYVAEGKVEAYREKDIRLWDIAAGVVLVRAAGGNVNIVLKNNFLCDVIASNVNIQENI